MTNGPKHPSSVLIGCIVTIVLGLVACTPGGGEEPAISSSVGSNSSHSAGEASALPLPESQGVGEQSLGPPVSSVVMQEAAFTERADGSPLTAVLATGVPAELSILDSRSGELIDSQTISLGPEAMVKSRAISPSLAVNDRNIYIGLTDGRGVSYDPDARAIRKMPTAPGLSGEMFWNAEAMEDGTIAFSTYPSARVLTYDPTKRSWEDFGSFGNKNKYTLGMSSHGSTIYVGTGTASPEVWSVNRKNGQRQRIPLPKSKEPTERDFAYDLEVVGDSLYVRVDGENRIYRLELSSKSWAEKIGGAARGLARSRPGEPEGLYWVGTDGKMRFHENATAIDTILPREDTVGAIRGGAWQDLDGDGDRESLLVVTTGASIQAWNSETRKSKTTSGSAVSAPSLIRSVGVGPDGSVLAGAYGTSPYFAVLPQDGQYFKHIFLRGQVESFGTAGGSLLAGTYPNARVHLTSTVDETAQDQLPTWTIGHDQDRPLAIEDLGDGSAAIATMPKFGQTGGAVSIVDQTGGVQRTFEDISPGRTPVALAYREHVLYVGTGATGGLGSELAKGNAEILAVDTRTGRTIKSSRPLPGDATISALKFDSEGTLWGWSVDSVFSLDPETLKVIKTRKYSKAVDEEPYARGRNLVDGGAMLFGSARGKVFSIDKRTLKRKNFALGANLVRGGDGLLYYSRGSTLYRWVPARP